MIGAIAGDMIGSIYEWHNIKTTEFPLFKPDCFFTDDSVLTVAIADIILTGADPAFVLKSYTRSNPGRGYGGGFAHWVESDDPKPYNSFGNGAGMRISPVGFAYDSLDEVLRKAEELTAVTHNHPEGIKGGCATAAAVFLARTGKSKDEIRGYISSQFGYNLNRTCDQIRPIYTYSESCQGTVPEAIIAFLESNSFESAIRLAVSLGGDCDTLTCITGGIAEAFYGGVPEVVRKEVFSRLSESLKQVVDLFYERYGLPLSKETD